MSPKIIYEDNDFFVLDKPAGWVVNKAKTTKDMPVVQLWLENKKYQLSGVDEYRSGIVHRLDKETSGILLVAKTKESFSHLQIQFKERKVKKEYLALTHGRITPKEGEIKVPVGRLPWNRKRFGILVGGRDSQTYYQVESYFTFDKGDYTLVRLKPKTGRTHQIRIHLKYLNFPIVSDSFYAGRKTARNDRKWCPRLFLHAEKISLRPPTTQKKIEFKTSLSSDLTRVLSLMQESD